jgi:CO/xanthine dehydrogenase Mo-binding subunit
MHTIEADPEMPLLYALRNDIGLNNPHFGRGLAQCGAGEPSIRPVAAAIANAIFDATGVRIRRVPFSPDRVKAALS